MLHSSPCVLYTLFHWQRYGEGQKEMSRNLDKTQVTLYKYRSQCILAALTQTASDYTWDRRCSGNRLKNPGLSGWCLSVLIWVLGSAKAEWMSDGDGRVSRSTGFGHVFLGSWVKTIVELPSQMHLGPSPLGMGILSSVHLLAQAVSFGCKGLRLDCFQKSFGSIKV